MLEGVMMYLQDEQCRLGRAWGGGALGGREWGDNGIYIDTNVGLTLRCLDRSLRLLTRSRLLT